MRYQDYQQASVILVSGSANFTKREKARTMKRKSKVKKNYAITDLVKIIESNHKEQLSVTMKCMSIVNDTLAGLMGAIMIFNTKVSEQKGE